MSQEVSKVLSPKYVRTQLGTLQFDNDNNRTLSVLTPRSGISTSAELSSVEDMDFNDGETLQKTADLFIKAKMSLTAIAKNLQEIRGLKAQYSNGVHSMEPLAEGIHGEIQASTSSLVAFSVVEDDEETRTALIKKIYPFTNTQELVYQRREVGEVLAKPISVLGVTFKDPNSIEGQIEAKAHNDWPTDERKELPEQAVEYLPGYDLPKAV